MRASSKELVKETLFRKVDRTGGKEVLDESPRKSSREETPRRVSKESADKFSSQDCPPKFSTWPPPSGSGHQRNTGSKEKPTARSSTILFPDTLGGLHLIPPASTSNNKNQWPASPQGTQWPISPQGYSQWPTSPQVGTMRNSVSSRAQPLSASLDRPPVDPTLIVDLVIDPNQPCHPGFTLGGLDLDIVDHIFIGGPPPRVLSNAEKGLDPGKLAPPSGSAVKPIRIAIKEGWRVVACDGVKVGSDLSKALSQAWCENRECIIAFEVDQESMEKLKALGSTHSEPFHEIFARRKLLKELGQLSSRDKARLLKSLSMQLRLVSTNAIMEAEVLLGTKPVEQMELAFSIQHLVQHDSMQFLASLFMGKSFSNEILLQRDSAGNVPLHNAQNIQAMNILKDREPRAQHMKNAKGLTPFQSYMTRKPQDMQKSLTATQVEDLLRLNENGISLAMSLEGEIRAGFLNQVASWESIESALRSNTSEVLNALNNVTSLEAWTDQPAGTWPELIALHCFGESQVWRDGQHTTQSRARLLVVWNAMKEALEQAPRSQCSAELLEKLLLASKGPKRPPLDPREPYREALMHAAAQMQAQGNKEMAKVYYWLTGEAADRVKGQADVPVAIEGIDQRDLIDKNERLQWQTPVWIKSDYDMLKILHDLKQARMAGASKNQDAVFDMLRIAMPEQYPALESLGDTVKQDFMIGCWFAAWHRGSCQGRQSEIRAEVETLLGPKLFEGCNLSCVDAAGVQIDLEQRLKRFIDIVEEVKRAGKQTKDARARQFFRKVVAFCSAADVSSFRYVIDTIEHLWAVLVQLQAQQTQNRVKIWRIKNGFRKDAFVSTGYRDIKLWLELGGSIMLELQLILRSTFDEEPQVRFPSQILTLHFDWSHLSEITTSMPCYSMLRAAEKQVFLEVAEKRKSLLLEAQAMEFNKPEKPVIEARPRLQMRTKGNQWLKAKDMTKKIQVVPQFEGQVPTGYTLEIEKIFGNEAVVLRHMKKVPAIYQNSIFNVRFSLDGLFLAAAGASGEIKVYDVKTGSATLLNNPATHEHDAITSIRWRPSRSFSPPLALASTSSKGVLTFYDVVRNRILGSHFEEGSGIMTCDWTSDCSRICTGGSSGEVKVYGVDVMEPIMACTASEFHGILGHSSRVLSLKCHPTNPDILFTAGLDTRVITWDLRTARPERVFSGPQMVGDAMDLSSDGDTILTGSCRREDALELWDAGSGTRICGLDWSSGEDDPFSKCLIYTASLSRDKKARFIVAGGKHDNLSRVYCGGAAVGTIHGGTTSFWSSECSLEDGRIAFGMSDGRCLLVKCARAEPNSPRSPKSKTVRNRF